MNYFSFSFQIGAHFLPYVDNWWFVEQEASFLPRPPQLLAQLQRTRWLWQDVQTFSLTVLPVKWMLVLKWIMVQLDDIMEWCSIGAKQNLDQVDDNHMEDVGVKKS